VPTSALPISIPRASLPLLLRVLANLLDIPFERQHPPSQQHAQPTYRADSQAPAIASGATPAGSAAAGLTCRLHECRQIDFVSCALQRKHARFEPPVFHFGYAHTPDSLRTEFSDSDLRHCRIYSETSAPTGVRIPSNIGGSCRS